VSEIVAVYGSLRQGERSHSRLRGATYLGLGWTAQNYALYVSEYPAVVPEPPLRPIRVELYGVSPALLTDLDEYEEHPLLYQRQQVEVKLDTGREQLAWLYFYRQLEPGAQEVPSGDWQNREDKT